MTFILKILGSNAATPSYGRYPTSQLLQVEQEYFLIDCGEGTQFQLLKYRCKTNRIGHILISHMHGDHFYGLIGLLAGMNLNRRTDPLHLYGPPMLAEMLTTLLRCSETWLMYPLHFHPLEPVASVIFEDEILSVSTIPLHHGTPCTGFLFREKPHKYRLQKEKLPGTLSAHQLQLLKDGHDLHDDHGKLLYTHQELTLPPHRSRSYAYCSDTAYHEPIVEQIQGVNLLYHEATFMADRTERAAQTLHSTTHQAATIARLGQVDQLLIGHYSARYKDLEPLLAEARSVFPHTNLALEGLTVSLT